MPLAIPYYQLPSMVWIRLSSSSTFDDCNGLNCFRPITKWTLAEAAMTSESVLAAEILAPAKL